MKDTNTLNITQSMQLLYPVMYNRLDKIASISAGKIPQFVKNFFVTLIQFCLDFFEKCPERFEEDYIERRGGEVKSEWFPNMPLLREKANYKVNDRTSLSDKEVMEYGCEKIFKDDIKI